MRLAWEKGALLRAQGVRLLIPQPGSLPRGDVAVLPEKGSPEHRFYEPMLRRLGIPAVAHRDPLAGLALALSYPRRSLGRLTIGVDPGRKCGLVVIGGPYVVVARKVDCEGIGPAVRSLADRIPNSGVEVLVGDGEGMLRAVESLESEDIVYAIVPENGSTSNPSRGPLESVLRDKDLLASLTIALRGARRLA